MLLLSALVALPATAQEATEALTAGLPTVVTGLDPLAITVPAGLTDLRVDLVDRDGNAASWMPAEPDDADAGVVSLDLAAPTQGVRPVNGPADVTVLAGGTALAQGTVVLDGDPAAPSLTATAKGRRSVLTWTPVAGPGPVTYAVARQTAAGQWRPVAQVSDLTFVDRDLDPGRYRYRLSAQVPAADDGVNTSAPSPATVRIAAPATGPDDPPSEPAPADPAGTVKDNAGPRVAQPVIPTLPPRPRPVAAAGRIGESVTPVRAATAKSKRTVAPVHRAQGPALGGIRSSLRLPRGIAPQVALPAPAGADPAPAPVAAPRPVLPVTVPPAGTLVIDSAGAFAQPRALVAVAAGLLGLTVIAQLAVLETGRRRRQLGGGRSPVST